MSERPKILYKYLPYNEKSESVLRDFTIKFTKPTDFNDPFDCKAADISEWTRKDWKTFFKIRLPKHYPLCSDVEIENCASVLARRTIDVKTSGEDFCDFVDDFGVSCFSEVNNDILMWSHYADHHKGFCIGFYSRTTNPYFNQVRRVKYNKKYPELSSSASRSLSDFSSKPTGFNPAKCWRFLVK